MSDPKLAIVGAGIAGLSMAIFANDQGLDSPVYEKQSSNQCAENVLWIAPNGLHLLKAIGLLESVLEIGCRQKAMIFADHRLNELSRLDCDRLAKTNEYPIVAIRRRDLMDILEAEVKKRQIRVHYNCPIKAAYSSGKRIEVVSEGLSRQEVDILIAADGIGSQTREAFFPESKIHFQGIRTYLGVSRTSVAKNFVNKTFEVWGHGTRFMLGSLDGESIHWSAMERVGYTKNSAPIPEDVIQKLLFAFRDYHPDIMETIRHADQRSIHRSNFGVVEGLKSYHNNSVVLMGDAAHGMPPNMGQGGSLALEDAAFLAKQLRVSHENALPTYSRARKPRADTIIGIANSMNKTFQPSSKILSLGRNSVARLLPNQLAQKRMERLYQVPFVY